MKKLIYLLPIMFLFISCEANRKAPKAPIENIAQTEQDTVKVEKTAVIPEEDNVPDEYIRYQIKKHLYKDSITGFFKTKKLSDFKKDSMEIVSLIRTCEPIEIMVDEPLIIPMYDGYCTKMINIVYNQPINGYKLKVTCELHWLYWKRKTAAMMEFMNERTGKTTYIFNTNFSVSTKNDSFWTQVVDDYKGEHNFDYNETVKIDKDSLIRIPSEYGNNEDSKNTNDIIYNQPISGYKLKITYDRNFECLSSDPTPVMMEFQNERNGTKFYIYNPHFYVPDLNHDETIFMDYDYAEEHKYLPLMGRDFNTSNAPFIFFDIDFDGEEELLITCPNAGQRGCTVYQVYKIRGGTVKQLTTPPFDDRIDDLCKIVPEDKTIIVHGSDGIDDWTNEYYRRLPNGKFEFYKIEEMAFPFFYINEKK